MNKEIDKKIKNNLEETINIWDFETRKKSYPESCICYQENKKCHNIENLNCFFCYCPEYNRSLEEGGCKINSPSGKYIKTTNGKIWDCSGCTFPHEKENVIKLLYDLFK